MYSLRAKFEYEGPHLVEKPDRVSTTILSTPSLSCLSLADVLPQSPRTREPLHRLRCVVPSCMFDGGRDVYLYKVRTIHVKYEEWNLVRIIQNAERTAPLESVCSPHHPDMALYLLHLISSGRPRQGRSNT